MLIREQRDKNNLAHDIIKAKLPDNARINDQKRGNGMQNIRQHQRAALA